ncbi:hypothetical protein M409DRAFT_55524 [Zasmidium cellare ATCC 36951]|uniref:C2H2-type domain-containing protein n=1 Tax=Zasmidium cellare ATCC 36951 TaxID=1080233 RepID=A0A6A6CHF8_ZASCE|nr:uncharacterized protein M409DRAFT_55524 [Zasmidium cellare ATCC 36951]KAF2165628.1 hypothetical protein M409DRAFT_55524 [Zasmidium cellare ATCC 36951]
MGTRPASFQPSKISRRNRLTSRLTRIKRYPCPELHCRSAFNRDSDLQRHRKCIHDRIPTLGDTCVYRCTVPGCAGRRKRLDHFKKHVKQAHPDHDLDCVVRESAVPVVDTLRTNFEDSRSRQRSSEVEAHHHHSASYAELEYAELEYAEDDCSERIHGEAAQQYSELTKSLPRSSDTLSQPPLRATRASSRAPIKYSQSPLGVDEGGAALNHATIVKILQRLNTIHVNWTQCSELPTDPTSFVPSIEHDSRVVPSDGYGDNYNQASGCFHGLLPTGNGGPSSGGGPGKGKEPARGQGWRNANASDARSNATSDGVLSGLPCVFCLFHDPTDDPTRDCCTRKRYICYLWPHHYRHDFTCCWTCFTRFENREALELHRRNGCTSICLDPACRNYDRPSTADSPCTHNTQFSAIVRWQRLYREAHHLARGVWIPDPTRLQQDVPDNLPPHHPMFPWSQPVPVHGAAPMPATNGTIPGPPFANMLAGIGGGIDGNFPQNAPQPPQVPETDQDRLRSILEIVWARVNRRVPSWTWASHDLWQRVPAVNSQVLLTLPVEAVSVTQRLQVLAAHYAMLIQEPSTRTPEHWLLVRRSTIPLIGDLVDVPIECPWDLAQAGPSIFRATVHGPEIDPALSSQSSMSTLNAATGLASTTGRDLQSISSAALTATNDFWQVDLSQPSQNPTPQTPMDRRPSRGSLTSPSEGPLYSATPSMNVSPFHAGPPTRPPKRPPTQPRHQQHTATQSDDFSELFNDLDDNEEET